MKITLNIVLLGAVLLLVYVCYRSIMNAQEFIDEREIREKAIQARLIDIRKAQIEFKNLYGFYAGSFDDLAKFLNEDKLPFVIKEGSLTDEQLEKGMKEADAIKAGLIRRDTTWVLAKDTLFGQGFDASALAFVPVEGVNAKFDMDTATIASGSGYTVKVFEASVPYDTYLGDLDHQELVNLKDKVAKMEKFAGLRVGSVKEINNNAGNWE
jgi:hypothetical protein